MSGKALIEISDTIRVWIEFRAPKKGELTWSVPADASPEEALEHVIVGRDVWSSGEAGFGYYTFRDVTPEFESEEIVESCGTTKNRSIHHTRNIVVHVDYMRSEPKLSNVIPHVKLL